MGGGTDVGGREGERERGREGERERGRVFGGGGSVRSDRGVK